MAQPWPGKANAVAGNFYKLPDGTIRLYAGGDEFRVAGTDSQGITRVDLGGLLSQFGRGLMPKGTPRTYGAGVAMHDFGGLPSSSEAPRIATGTDVDARPEQGADLDMAAITALSKKYGSPPVPVVLADDVDARDSEYRRMAQQYAPGADLWATDAGKKMIQAAQSNQYEGDAAGLPEYYTNQRNVGTGAMPEIIDAMGYTGAMAEWAKNNPALAMREYNKKFGNSYAGTGPSDEEIKAAMEAGQFSPAAGSPNPLGKTGMARESNTAQMAQDQPTDVQAANTQEAADYGMSGVPGLKGKQMLGEQIKNMIRRGFN